MVGMNKIWIAVAALAVAVVVIAVSGVLSTPNLGATGNTQAAIIGTGSASQDQRNVKEFTIKAFRFGYEPDAITVNKGDVVRLVIDNTDALHGIRIPEFGVSGDDVIEFTANKTGEFTWYCTNMCGSGHRAMNGTLTEMTGSDRRGNIMPGQNSGPISLVML